MGADGTDAIGGGGSSGGGNGGASGSAGAGGGGGTAGFPPKNLNISSKLSLLY